MADLRRNDDVIASRQRPESLPALTGLRMVGALWVTLYHLQQTLYEALPWTRFFEFILSKGEFGVPLFFVLSGYVIFYNYGTKSLLKPVAIARFMWRRVARLWPVNVVTTLAAVPVVYWSVKYMGYWGAPLPDWYSKEGLLGSLFMVNALGSPTVTYAWNQPTWSLSGEIAVYLVFPLVLALVLVSRARSLTPRWLWALPAGVLAWAIVQHGPDIPYAWLLNLFVMFVVGVLVSLMGRPHGVVLHIAVALQIAAPLVLLWVSWANKIEWMIVALAAWVWSLSAARGPGVWLFSTKPLQIAGQASYSLYMVHWVAFGYAYILMNDHPQLKERFYALTAVGMVTVACAVSWALWRFFEHPAREAMNRFFEGLVRRTRRGRAASQVAVQEER